MRGARVYMIDKPAWLTMSSSRDRSMFETDTYLLWDRRYTYELY